MQAPKSDLVSLSGWGRYPIVETSVLRPEKRKSVADMVTGTPKVLGRGLGRSYGDAAECDGGTTILMERLNRISSWDEATGLVRLEAGLTIADLLSVFIPKGWMCPVVPGTKFVTIGGAIAADIHGKNHHRDGSFSSFVRRFWLLTANGIIECSQESNADVFWATIGGMGLTGIILEAEVQLSKIESSSISYRSIRAKNLDDLMQLFDRFEANHHYSVAWIDCLASGNQLGRGVLMLGDSAPEDPKASPEAVSSKTKQINVPIDMPTALLNRFSMSAFNSLFYLAKPNQEKMMSYDSFFFPLDALNNWNRMYGKRGFIQYQCLIPPDQSASGLKQILNACSSKGWGSFLAVLKRFGTNCCPSNQSLSFPKPGYTLTLDFPVKDGLNEFTQHLDQIVLEHGGRVYLAKDACLTKDTFRQMYPEFPSWLEVKRKVDPKNVFSSALSERLELF